MANCRGRSLHGHFELSQYSVSLHKCWQILSESSFKSDQKGGFGHNAIQVEMFSSLKIEKADAGFMLEH